LNIIKDQDLESMPKQFQAICVERYPKHALSKALTKGPKSLKAIFQKNAVWKPNSQGLLTVTFGTNKCAGCDPEASWSMIGSESTAENPSMNLGFIDPPYSSFDFNNKQYPINSFKDATRNYCGSYSDGQGSCSKGWEPGATVIHEFGHALGMMHEHQNNLFASNKIRLNRAAVIEYYDSIGLGAEGAQTNMLELYDCSKNPQNCAYEGSVYDPDSIMLYALPDNLVIGPNPTKANFRYSTKDKQWLANEYPMSVNYNEQPQLTIKFIDFRESNIAWKQAWTTKVIMEKLCPLVGVKMRFVWTDGTSMDYKPIANVPNTLPPTLPPTAMGTPRPTERPTSRPIISTERPTTERPKISTNTESSVMLPSGSCPNNPTCPGCPSCSPDLSADLRSTKDDLAKTKSKLNACKNVSWFYSENFRSGFDANSTLSSNPLVIFLIIILIIFSIRLMSV
jgi:hypothetical protein